MSASIELVIDNPPSVRNTLTTLKQHGLTAEVERLNARTWKLIIYI